MGNLTSASYLLSCKNVCQFCEFNLTEHERVLGRICHVSWRTFDWRGHHWQSDPASQVCVCFEERDFLWLSGTVAGLKLPHMSGPWAWVSLTEKKPQGTAWGKGINKEMRVPGKLFMKFVRQQSHEMVFTEESPTNHQESVSRPAMAGCNCLTSKSWGSRP